MEVSERVRERVRERVSVEMSVEVSDRVSERVSWMEALRAVRVYNYKSCKNQCKNQCEIRAYNICHTELLWIGIAYVYTE